MNATSSPVSATPSIDDDHATFPLVHHQGGPLDGWSIAMDPRCVSNDRSMHWRRNTEGGTLVATYRLGVAGHAEFTGYDVSAL